MLRIIPPRAIPEIREKTPPALFRKAEAAGVAGGRSGRPASAASLLAVLALIGGCTPRLVDSWEEYRGRHAAAIAPVAMAGAARRPGQDLSQVTIQRQLETSGLFARVLLLSDPGEGNEAEIIIAASALPVQGDKARMRVRVREKTSGRITLDEIYSSPCRGCVGSEIGSGRERAAVARVAEQLEADLSRLYR